MAGSETHSIQGIGEALAVIHSDLSSMKPDVRSVSMGVVALTTQMADVKESIVEVKDRISKVETRAHQCDQVETIAQHKTDMGALAEKIDSDVVYGVETRGQLVATTDRVKDMEQEEISNKSFRRSTAIWIIGLVLGVSGSVFGGVWWFAQYKAESSYRATTNSVSTDRNTQRIMDVEREIKLGNRTVIQEIGALREEVLERNEADKLRAVSFDEWYRGLSKIEQARLRRTIKGVPPVPM